jgi:hypothetical protein
MESLNPKDLSALCARINAAIDVKEFIPLLQYYPEKALQAFGLWRMYCPLHEETLFRTLVINPRRNTCHCEYSCCVAHQPSDLVDVLCKTRGLTRPDTLVLLIETFGLERLKITPEQEEQIRRLIEEDRELSDLAELD